MVQPNLLMINSKTDLHISEYDLQIYIILHANTHVNDPHHDQFRRSSLHKNFLGTGIPIKLRSLPVLMLGRFRYYCLRNKMNQRNQQIWNRYSISLSILGKIHFVCWVNIGNLIMTHPLYKLWVCDNKWHVKGLPAHRARRPTVNSNFINLFLAVVKIGEDWLDN